MLAQLSKTANSLMINDGMGPTIFFSKGDEPQEVPVHRIFKFLQSGQLQKAQYAGIDNDVVVAVDFNSLDFTVRPVGPAKGRT